MKTLRRARSVAEVLEEHSDRLLALPGVVGTGVGTRGRKPCIRVLVVKKSRELARRIPAALEGYPVVTEETGRIEAIDPE